MQKMKVAIIGAGLQCRRRAPAVRACAQTELAVIADRTFQKADAAAKDFGCAAVKTWQEAVAMEEIGVVLVCTPPYAHAEIGAAALRAGKHVLCEKPLARSLAEADAMLAAARQAKKILKCGFNHRHHPAVREAKAALERGDIGQALFARCRYGICGRPEYEKEWRADPDQAAGGQFIEQGTHAIDLFRWFLGEITEATGMTARRFFTGQPLDEDGMAVFRTSSAATASLHSSLTQWKNLFSFEVFGRDGYAAVDGLGASYGTERLVIGQRDFEAPFSENITEYRGGDVSWKEEWKEFIAAISEGREPLGNGEDGRKALQIALAVYESEKTGKIIKF
ncbi:MAG: Gfo/Idh/MocA family oxidoreductase [Kiritimatiellae bacterium]|nr:Gfo/Idh/MocA family oxidoreductase [Kiritimatiellia bacterium]